MGTRPLLACAVLVLACAHGGVVPQPTSLDVERVQTIEPGLTLQELQAGRAAYLSRCSSCHPVHGPGEFPAEKWPGLIARMQREKKLKLPEADRILIERYLVAFSASAPRSEASTVSLSAGSASTPR